MIILLIKLNNSVYQILKNKVFSLINRNNKKNNLSFNKR